MTGTVIGRRPAFILPGYRKPPSPFRRIVRNTAFYLLCILIGLVYGFVYSALPPSFLVYMAIPIVLLGLLVIWALPDLANGPVKLLGGMLLAYSLLIPLWPNYLAFSAPGLPWISFRRLLNFPMGIVCLICLSTSSSFRASVKAALSEGGIAVRLLGLLLLLQFATIAISRAPGISLNISIDVIFSIMLTFIASCWFFQKERYVQRFINAMLAAGFLLCVLGIVESTQEKVLWSDSIPSFLAVGDEAVDRTLTSRTRDGRYRVTATFSVALAFAEYLALIVPFILLRLFRSRTVGRIAFWLAIDALFLFVIVITTARLGIVGWLVSHAAFVSLWAFRRWRTRRTDIVAPAVALLYSMFALFFFVGMFTIPAIRNRTIGGGSTTLSDSGREAQFAMFWPKLFANPFGNGAGQSGVTLGWRSQGGLLSVDSYVITVGLDFGVLGLIAFFGAFLVVIWRCFYSALFGPERHSELVGAVGCSLLVITVIRYVLSQPDNMSIFYMLLGMGIAVLMHQRAAAPSLQPDRSQAPAPALTPSLA